MSTFVWSGTITTGREPERVDCVNENGMALSCETCGNIHRFPLNYTIKKMALTPCDACGGHHWQAPKLSEMPQAAGAQGEGNHETR